MNKIISGDKVLFNGEVLTASHIDSWFGIWVFKEKSYPPVEYQKYNPPKRINTKYNGRRRRRSVLL